MISRPIAIGVIGAIVVIIAFVLNYSNDKDPIEQQTSKALVLKQEKQLMPPPKETTKIIDQKPRNGKTTINGTVIVEQGIGKPSFDLVRVDPEGNMVIAGKGANGATIEILDGDVSIGIVEADDRGEWVFIPKTRLAPGSRILILRDITNPTKVIESENAVVLVIPAVGKNIAGLEGKVDNTPLAMVVPRNEAKNIASRLIQMPVTNKPEIVSDIKIGRVTNNKESKIEKPALILKMVDYNDSGMVIFSGFSQENSILQVYIDNLLVGVVTADSNGAWDLKLKDNLKPGKYIIRVDQVSSSGTVLDRIKLPFVRVPVIDAKKEKNSVVIQPGNSLWRIAARVYGSGFRYTEIYEANANQIGDPNLIYPGQIFKLPTQLKVE
jgi:hypothetical protein